MKELTKEELLKNPLVKEIATSYHAMVGVYDQDTAWGMFVDKQTKKDWEITAYIWKETKQILQGACLQKALKVGGHIHEGYSIYRVKRLSDGVEFQIGDMWVEPDEPFIIDQINIVFGDVLMTGHSVKCKFNYRNKPLTNAVKAEKLWTTEDGVDMYDEDKVWSVDTSFSDPYEQLVEKKYIIRHGRPFSHFYKDDKYFSNKKAAEEYILMNKPYFSIIDIENVLNTVKYQNSLSLALVSRLKELAKSKM